MDAPNKHSSCVFHVSSPLNTLAPNPQTEEDYFQNSYRDTWRAGLVRCLNGFRPQASGACACTPRPVCAASLAFLWVLISVTDWLRVPGGLLRKSFRYWEGLGGCSMPLLPRDSSWVVAGAGVGLGPTRGSHVAVSAPVCGLRWRDVASTPGGSGLVSAACDLAPLCHSLGYLDSGVVPFTTSWMCRWPSGQAEALKRMLTHVWAPETDNTWPVTTPCSTRRFWTPSVLTRHCCPLCPCPCDLAVSSVLVAALLLLFSPGLSLICSCHWTVVFQPSAMSTLHLQPLWLFYMKGICLSAYLSDPLAGVRSRAVTHIKRCPLQRRFVQCWGTL